LCSAFEERTQTPEEVVWTPERGAELFSVDSDQRSGPPEAGLLYRSRERIPLRSRQGLWSVGCSRKCEAGAQEQDRLAILRDR
jgi:hypothetical protein